MDCQDLRTKHYKFFQHRQCEYFPCHDISDPDRFNCIFCYCPLYALGRDCGGNFEYTEQGVKSCEKCVVPHRRENYNVILTKLTILMERMKKSENVK